MDLYAEDMLAAADLALSAALVIVSGISYARSRSGRLLVPLVAGLIVMAVSVFLTFRAAFSSEAPGPWDLPVAAILLAVITVLMIFWLARGRAGRPDRKTKG